VHRSLITLLESDRSHAGKSMADALRNVAGVAEHLSLTERRAMTAERDASDRYRVAYMAERIGEVFSGVITGMNEFGLYVTLSGTGVSGFVHVRALGGDFFHHDAKRAALVGRRSGARFELGQKLAVRVREASTLTGSLLFEPEWTEMEAPAPIHVTDERHGARRRSHLRRDRDKRKGKSGPKGRKKD
jgi:ribonuclease R